MQHDCVCNKLQLYGVIVVELILSLKDPQIYRKTIFGDPPMTTTQHQYTHLIVVIGNKNNKPITRPCIRGLRRRQRERTTTGNSPFQF